MATRLNSGEAENQSLRAPDPKVSGHSATFIRAQDWPGCNWRLSELIDGYYAVLIELRGLAHQGGEAQRFLSE